MKDNSPKTGSAATQSSGGSSRATPSRGGFLMLAAAAAKEFDTWRQQTKAARENELLNGKAGLSSRDQKMSSADHQATVDRGLKMKIKRNKSGASKHEIVKHEQANKALSGESSQQASSMVLEKAKPHILLSEKDKSPMKTKGVHKKEKAVKDKVGRDTGVSNGGGCSSFSNGLDSVFGQISVEPKPGDTAQSMKKELSIPVDPYEFNAKVEDGIGIPMKKIKTEKIETASSPLQLVSQEMHDVATATSDVGVATEPECLGPCEPGTSVNLEGIVWHETENGMLVVNVTWRGKTYVGTLLDATKHDWAPPRFGCDSPVSDFETRTPKGRGKRSRAAACTPVQDPRINGGEGRKLRKGRRGSNTGTFQAPPSPAKSDISSVSTSSLKRKGRPMDIDLSDSAKPSKRSRSNSRGTPNAESPLPVLIECPEPNCNKKYKHINGLRYHQTHAHHISQFANADGDEDTKDDVMEDITEELPSRGKKKDNMEQVSANENKKKDTVVTNSNEKVAKEDTTDNANVAEKAQSKSSSETNKADKVEVPVVRNKKDSPPAGDVPTSSTASKNTTQSAQIYQLSAAPMACLGGVGMVSQASSQLVTSTVSSSSTSPVVTSIPITVTAVTTVAQPLDLKSDAVKNDKNDKAKSKTVTRPIVPAPSPQMIALSSSVNVTHSNLTPVTTHTQVSPQLKPIQPKPTIMGEPANINPALVGLKEKKAKQKKKIREKDLNTSVSSSTVSNNSGSGKIAPKEDLPKCERAGVIRAVPSPAKPSESSVRKESANTIDNGRPVADSQPQRNAPPPMSSKGIDLSQSSRMAQPPSALKVNSPLQVSTPDSRKTPLTDDVQSPAYSDISDANESGSPQNESPQKQKEEPSSSAKKEEARVPPIPQQPESNRANMGSYGMYPSYYGQPQYMMSNMSPQNMSSQPQASPGQGQKQTPTNPKKDSAVPASEAKKVPSSDEIKKPVEKERRPVEEKKEEVNPKPEYSNPVSQQQSQQQMQDYQIQHQKWVQQQMYALQALPPHAQYQYLAAYGYAIDPQYHMHMMSNDPQYRLQYDRLIEEQKRMQEEQAKREIEAKKQSEVHGQNSVIDASAKRGESLMPKHLPPSASQGSYDKSVDGGKGGDRHNDKDLKELALREKQNENHQILKENIDLKAQMDKSRYGGDYDQYRGLKERQQEELRRYQMYQEQKRIEQKKNLELAKSADHVNRTPENLSAKSVNSSRLVSEGLKPQSDDHVKKEIVEAKPKDNHRVRDHSDSTKSMSDGKVSDEKLRTPSSDKLRTPETSKSRIGFSSKSASPSTPTNSALNMTHGNRTPGSGNSYPNSYNMSSYPYMQQSSPYGQPIGQYDQNHPMYRGMNPSAMIGYPGGYLHPSQLPYRVSGEVEEKDPKSANLTKGMLLQHSESENKAPRSEHGGQGAPNYGGVHKIHELTDKGRSAVSHRSSPVSQKALESRASPSTQATSATGSFEKHRELSNSPPAQRHVHTHHHTHVVSGGYPMFDSYGAGKSIPNNFTPNSPAAAAIPHQYPAK